MLSIFGITLVFCILLKFWLGQFNSESVPLNSSYKSFKIYLQ
jgi:hypothetical protein